ncbi:hypothetical protein JM93_01990 [Roseibium hamelinense]|uniref:Uncharacterized protein n=1 Tax=Roseibium hamelinense TaxID=150831 RepID=A0A562T1A8_9HYPH|nr:hypothetical protein [Roseibium hamelinense]MTI44458.1 hypothetical protein [Roseibium hamelinense]TWI87425.1 hypothetical protein JM93_01990 [Roseibium hamelinense]
MTNFKAIIDFFGLSTEEASAYLGVDQDAVIRWCNMPESPPKEVWRSLVILFDTVRFAAEDAAKAADLDNINTADLNTLPIAQHTAGGPANGPNKAIAAMAITSLARAMV